MRAFVISMKLLHANGREGRLDAHRRFQVDRKLATGGGGGGGI